MKFRILFSLFTALLFASCNAQTSKSKTITAVEFGQKIRATPKPQVLDVRTPQEYSEQHIENAENIDWNSDGFAQKAATLDKTKPVFVYCLSGGRSSKAAAKLEELGFTNIYELDGGIMKWNAAGLSQPSDKIIGMCSQEYGELLNTDKKVLVSFYADWCAPCKIMTPYMTKMQADLNDKVTIIRLNADENKTLVSELKIDELPTLLLYENKEVKWRHSGFISEEELKKQL